MNYLSMKAAFFKVFLFLTFISLFISDFAFAQETIKPPTTTPIEWHLDKRNYNYTCKEGEITSYKINLTMEMDMKIREGWQEAKLSNITGFELGYTEKCIGMDKNGIMDIEIVFDLVKIKASMNVFGTLVDMYIDNDYLKAYKDGVLVVDTKEGIGMAIAYDFFRDFGLYKKSGKVKASPAGAIISKVKGDDVVVKFFETTNIMPGLPIQILAFPEKPINKGDTWDFSFMMEKMESVTFKRPLKQVVRFTLEGLVKVDGAECIQVSLDSPLNVKDIKAMVKMGDADVEYDVRNMSRKATGNFYFDPVRGKFIFGKVNLDAKVELSAINPETGKNVNMDLTIKMDFDHLRTSKKE
jgi:hypothetical protein